MRAPLSWLRDYVEFDMPAEQLAERLTLRGMEVQAIERVGGDWSSVVVGELLEVVRHPRAERLSLARVRVSEDGEPLSIVCGADNIRPGQRVPVAMPGAVLPGGRQIGVSTIQGARSEGMLCSGEELKLTADADGILILSDAPGEGPAIGTPIEQLAADTVLDIDVKPNRGDALSLVGLAREVAALTGGSLRWPPIEVPEQGDPTTDHVSVEVTDNRLCPRFVARYVDGLVVGPSPTAVQLRLTAAGVRPVSNVVDASNYVMIELGKPIHTFDAAAVADGRIVVRAARAGERIVTLDHVERELDSQVLLIADQRGPLGIAGVMGGADSEVGASTTAVIVESAVFDPLSIRHTAQRYSLRSEASLRFEKGQESRLARLGADRTAQLLSQWAAGRPAVGAIDTHPHDEPPRRVAFRPARVNRLLGTSIETDQLADLLGQVEIGVEPFLGTDQLAIIEDSAPLAQAAAIDALVAVVPVHRRDINIEADVAEEICRLYGYEQLTPTLPDTEPPAYRGDPRRLTDTLRELVAGRGLSEIVTNGLISPDDHRRLGYAADDAATISITNPVSVDHSQLRRSLLPGLVRVLAANERQRRDSVAIFELGPIHAHVEQVAWQADRLALLMCGPWPAVSWAAPAREADVADAKGIIEAVARRLGIDSLFYGPTDVQETVEHAGRTAAILASHEGQQVIVGRVGELDPRYLAAYDTRAERAVFGVLNIAALERCTRTAVSIGQLARLPVVERDLAVVVGRDVAQADVAQAIRGAAGPLLEEAWLFDRYQGPPLHQGEISLAYRLRYQPIDEAAAEGQLDESLNAIGRALREQLGARIRGEGEVSG
jgi:phenylalanyl-tRNA synthetase beta chain